MLFSQKTADGLKRGGNISGTKITWPPTTPKTLLANNTEYVQIVPCSVIKAASTISQSLGSICVLNAAGIEYPVNRWLKGDASTESSLLTCTTLSAALKESWYSPRLFPDTIVYTPSTQVFQLSPAEGLRLPYRFTFYVDFISCAPVERPEVGTNDVNCVKTWQYKDSLVKQAMKAKIRYILQTAVTQNVHMLVLGAFGCDHGHPVELISELFREALFGRDGQG